MRARLIVLMMVAALAAVPTAQTDNLQRCISAASADLEALSSARAGEVISERMDLERVLSRVKSEHSGITSSRSTLASRESTLRLRRAERQSQQEQLERDERQFQADFVDWERRRNIDQADVAAFTAQCTGKVSEEQAAGCKSWEVNGNRQTEAIRAEMGRLAARDGELARSRQDLARRQEEDAAIEADIADRRERIDQRVEQALQECAPVQRRAAALRTIANAPARSTPYESPESTAARLTETAERLAVDLTKDVGLALLTQANSKSGIQRLSATLKGAIRRQGTRNAVAGWTRYGAQRAGVVILLTDFGLDVSIAGVERRNREVEKNILLVGDYARVMQTMAHGDPLDPTYQAVRQELERLQREMPSDNTQVLLEGLWNQGLVVNALGQIAAKFAAGKVAKISSGPIAKWRWVRLGNAQRQAWSERGARVFMGGLESRRELVGAGISTGTEEVMKRTGKQISESLDAASNRR